MKRSMVWVVVAFFLGCTAPAVAQDKDRGFVRDKGIGLDALQEEKRVALIIGNANYDTSPLKNPVNDARAIGKALKNQGFEVSVHEDLDQKQMKRAIRDFGKVLKDTKGVGLFYFAGHGMQVGGRNYLIPIDAKLEGEADIEIEAVDVGAVLAKMEIAKNRLNVVILDACRNNPFSRAFRSANKGLAFMDAPSGTLIAYATSPGNVARDGEGDNGLFTSELLKEIKVPGRKVEEVFKAVRASVQTTTEGQQVPWESSSLVGDFYFNLPDKATAEALAKGECPPGTRREGSGCVAVVNLDCPGGTHFEKGRGCVADKAPPAQDPEGAVAGQVPGVDNIRARLKAKGWTIGGETSMSQLPNAKSHGLSVFKASDPSKMAMVLVLDFEREGVAKTYASSMAQSRMGVAHRTGKRVVVIQGGDPIVMGQLSKAIMSP